jgi:phage terminase large subunit-like protein
VIHDVTRLSDREKVEAQSILVEQAKRRAAKIYRYFPEDGPYRRALYPKHLEFMRAGAVHRERLFLKGNRVGGTEMGAFEATLHLTGRYDEIAPWWEGKRFDRPIKMWAAGDTGKTTRDILQAKLVGDSDGAGMLPAHFISHKTAKQGLSGAYENIYVQHVTGGLSLLQFKSYDQRREAFQGTEQDLVWLDEECPTDIYSECLLRTAATSDFAGGIIILTFTPLMGLTELILSFLPGGQVPVQERV